LAGTNANPVVTDHEMAELRTLIEERSGVHLDDSRERFLTARVREHMEEQRLAHGTDLLRRIRSSNVEYDMLLERLLTQETRFFRYPEIFKAFEGKVLPEQHMKKFWESPRALRIWSAGCATGEEPYSIAIGICESLAFAEAWNINVLATDISRRALAFAERGLYPKRALEGVSPQLLENYFTRQGELYEVKPRLRDLVNFAQVNLAQSVYMGRFDVIFCMNVLIYFTDERRAALVQRFYEYLEPGGYLLLGHAEAVASLPVKFQTVMADGARLLQKPMNVPAEPSTGEAQR